ncbi:hypothetical protein [Candidatus Spongiihabitans sp.]|uniref:hypothetical protein n=1 Tax=Candidatus Spongiihabitans sp. TaxID=3101308 RepID=UPI003C7D3C67
MSRDLRVGAILHHRGFPFEDGTRRNKYLVLLGAKIGCDYLFALTTSKIGRKKAEPGCHHSPKTYFFIPGDEKNFFPRNTWIVLGEPRTINRAEIIEKGFLNIIQIVANLEKSITTEIRNCLKASMDITDRQKQLL